MTRAGSNNPFGRLELLLVPRSYYSEGGVKA